MKIQHENRTVKSYLLPLLHGKHGGTGSGTGPPQFSMQNSRTFKATNTTNFLHRAAKTTGVFPMQGGGTRMLSKLATSLWGPDCSSGSQTRAQTCGWWEEHLYSGLWRHTPEGLTPGSRAAPFWPVTKFTMLADSWQTSGLAIQRSAIQGLVHTQAYPKWAGRQLGALALTCSA